MNDEEITLADRVLDAVLGPGLLAGAIVAGVLCAGVALVQVWRWLA